MTGRQGRGVCAECGADVALKTDGKVRVHAPPDNVATVSRRCAGTDRTPERTLAEAAMVAGGSRPYTTAQLGKVAVTCWCEKGVVFVSENDVWEGRTESCGRRGCARPAT